MGTPDLESTQKGAPGDTQIVHFRQDPIMHQNHPPLSLVANMVSP